MALKVLSAEQNMVLSPLAWERLLVELPWLVSTQCCICQVWFLKHSVSPTYSLMLACVEPKCACFLFTGLLWRKGEDRPDRNREQAIQPDSCEQLYAHLNTTFWPERKTDYNWNATEPNLLSSARTVKSCLSPILCVPTMLRLPGVSEAARILVNL